MSSLSKCMKALILSSIFAFPALSADNLEEKELYYHKPPSLYDHFAENRTKDNSHLITNYMANHPFKELKEKIPYEIWAHIASFDPKADWLDYILAFSWVLEENIDPVIEEKNIDFSIEKNLYLFRKEIQTSFESLIINKDNAQETNIKPLQNIYYISPRFFNDKITYLIRKIILDIIAENRSRKVIFYNRLSLNLPMFSEYDKQTNTLNIFSRRLSLMDRRGPYSRGMKELLHISIETDNNEKVLKEFIDYFSINNELKVQYSKVSINIAKIAILFINTVNKGAEFQYIQYINMKKMQIRDSNAISYLANIRSLDLKENQIGDEGAKALSTLTNLTTLDLSDNKIGYEGVKALSMLTNLTSLNLCYNQIGDEGAKALSTLTNLTTLDLSSNTIGNEGVKALSMPTNLTSINLCYNKIGDEGAKALSTLTNLTTLDLSSNKIGDEGVKALSMLTNLTSINLYYNQIGGEGAKALSMLPKLTTLNLIWNKIRGEGAKALSILTNLTTLDLSRNQIGDEGAKALSSLTNLTTLDLSSNRIGDEGVKALSIFTNLTTLYLSSNQIGDDGVKVLSTLTNLTAIYLSSNKIGDEGAKALRTFTNLTTLYLSSNQIGDEGIKVLRTLTNLTNLYLIPIQ